MYLDKQISLLKKALEKTTNFDNEQEKIDFILDVTNEFKQLIIGDVSHQRELLNFLAKEWNPNQCTMDSTIEDWYIEEIIEKFNCG